MVGNARSTELPRETTNESPDSQVRPGDVVEVMLPAHGAYVSVLRTTTAALASRLDFTLDEIEDLRIGVDEACALILAQADAQARLLARFRLDGPELEITVSAAASRPRIPARDSFAWTVLTALAGAVSAYVDDDGHMTIRLVKSSILAGAGKASTSDDPASQGLGDQ